MASIKCPECGAANYADAESCTLCQAKLTAAAPAPENNPGAAWGKNYGERTFHEIDVAADPEVAKAGNTILFLAILNVVVGLIGVFVGSETLGFGWTQIIAGVVYFILGRYAKTGSIKAVLAVITLYTLDTIVVIGMYIHAGRVPPIFVLFIRGGILVGLLKSFSSILDVRNQNEDIRARAKEVGAQIKPPDSK